MESSIIAEALRGEPDYYGRIGCFYTQDPDTHLGDPTRKVIYLFGPSTFRQLGSLTTYEMLLQLGKTKEYISNQLAAGGRFKLVLIKKSQADVVLPATWANAAVLCKEVYPDAYASVLEHMTALQTTPLSQFEAAIGSRFFEIEKNKKTDERFLTYDRWLKRPAQDRTAHATRLFLYCQMRLLDLFRGDGYTYSEDGRRGDEEFFCVNKPLKDFQHHAVMNLDLNLSM